MPLAIADGGRKIRRTASGRAEIAASVGPAAVGVTPSAKRSRAASEAPTTKIPAATESATTTTESTTPMGASESTAVEPTTTTMETATTTVEPAATTAVETAATATAAVTAATTALGVGLDWVESETNEGCECDQGLDRLGRAHNLHLPHDVAVQRRARSLSAGGTGSYLIRF